jgi:histidyl-tRNA synthetase
LLLQVARLLRSAGWSVNLLLTVKKPAKAFEFANKIGACRVAYVAPDEWAAGRVRVKDLRAAKDAAARGEDVLLEDLNKGI